MSPTVKHRRTFRAPGKAGKTLGGESPQLKQGVAHHRGIDSWRDAGNDQVKR